MANSFVNFELEDGTVISVESNEPAKAGAMSKISASGSVIEKATNSLEQSMGTVRAVSDAVNNNLKKSTARPDKVAVEFSLKFSGSVGNFILAKAEAEANIKVSLSWDLTKNDKKD